MEVFSMEPFTSGVAGEWGFRVQQPISAAENGWPVNHTNGITCMRGFGLPVLLLPQSLDRAAQLTTSAHAPARPGNAGTLPVATELQIPRVLENAGGSSHRPTQLATIGGRERASARENAEPNRPEPLRIEPSHSEPSRSEPIRVAPNWAEPLRTEPSRLEPNRARGSARGAGCPLAAAGGVAPYSVPRCVGACSRFSPLLRWTKPVLQPPEVPSGAAELLGSRGCEGSPKAVRKSACEPGRLPQPSPFSVFTHTSQSREGNQRRVVCSFVISSSQFPSVLKSKSKRLAALSACVPVRMVVMTFAAKSCVCLWFLRGRFWGCFLSIRK